MRVSTGNLLFSIGILAGIEFGCAAPVLPDVYTETVADRPPGISAANGLPAQSVVKTWSKDVYISTAKGENDVDIVTTITRYIQIAK